MTSLIGLVDVNAGSLLERFQSSNKARPRHTQHTDLVRVYRYSSHARALEAQKRAYRNSARENERVFGRGRTTSRRSYSPYIIYNKTFPNL